MIDLSHVSAWVFDMDDTLYPPEQGVMKLVQARINAFMVQAVGLPSDEARALLRALGLTHLIAISGFHVGLVAGFFALLASATWWLFPLLGRVAPRTQAAAVAALGGAAREQALQRPCFRQHVHHAGL